MSDSEKSVDLVKSLPPNLIQQVRQLSVPLWVRLMALLTATSVFLIGAVLVWLGSLASCAPACDPRLLDAGIKVLSLAFLPLLVLLYLVFSETGVRALTRKTRELLEKTIPLALTAQSGEGPVSGENDIRSSEVQFLGPDAGPTAYYRVILNKKGGRAALLLKIDLNVRKSNVVFHFPSARFDAGAAVHRKLKASLSGAAHEGYDIDQEVAVSGDHVLLCARKRLTDDFLWDPAAKLYFAQDLRFFVYSVAGEAWDWLNENE